MRKALLYACALLCFGNAQAAEPKPGLWNLTVTTTPDGGGQPLGPFYRSQCLSQEDIRDPEQLFAESGMDDCTFKGKKQQGSRYDFTLQCGGALPMSGQGTVNYGAESLEGELNLVTEIQGLDIATTTIASGQRVGECAAQPAQK